MTAVVLLLGDFFGEEDGVYTEDDLAFVGDVEVALGMFKWIRAQESSLMKIVSKSIMCDLGPLRDSSRQP